MKTKAKQLLSRRGYAQSLGITPGAVNKAMLAGKIDMAGNQVDPGGPLSLAYEAVQRQRLEAARAAVEPAAVVRSGAGPKPIAPASPTRTKLEADIERIGKVCRRLELQNEKLASDNARSRGDLISTAFARQVFEKWWSIEDVTLKRLGDRIFPDLMAVCGIDDASKGVEISRTINAEVERDLAYIRDALGKWLATIPVTDGAERTEQ